MNLILVEDDDFVGEHHVRLRGRRHRHIREIHRASRDRVLRVGQVDGRIGHGRVVAMDDEYVELILELDQLPPEPVPITLVLALPRPPMLRRVLQAVASVGIKKVVLLHADRVEKSFWQSHAVSSASIREQLILGLEQGGDCHLPEVWLRPKFRPFVDDELPELAGGSRCLVAHPEGHACPTNIEGAVTVAIGPEGGWVPFEVERLRGVGFEPVHLGSRILRVETAVMAVIGRVLSLG